MSEKPQSGGLFASSEKHLILVADDDRGTRNITRRVMEREGYEVIEAEDGEDCLEKYNKFRPDLVLLDGMMPILDGFEACAQLRQLPQGEQLPILMVTALEDNTSVDKAFAAGATDYITKPIHWAVLRQRVRRLLAARHLEKIRSDLTHMIVHDMKTPLMAISSYVDIILEEEIDDSIPINQLDILQRIQRNGRSLLDMTNMILDLQRMEEGKLALNLSENSACEVLQQVAENLNWMAQSYGVNIQLECPQPELVYTLDWGLMSRVLVNLVTNAIKHSVHGGNVTLKTQGIANSLKPGLLIAVKDEGEGIAMEDQKRIFERYTQATVRQGGSRTDSGLGLTFCKMAVEAQGGRIELQSTPNLGSTFSLIFPSSSLPD